MAGVALVDVLAVAVGALIRRDLLDRLIGMHPVGMHPVAALARFGGNRRLLELLGRPGVGRHVLYDARRAARSSSSSRRSTSYIFMRA